MEKKIFYKTNNIYSYLGLLFPFVFIGFILIAIFFAPWFSWTNNYISDLAGLEGEKPFFNARGLPSIILNIGLIFTGFIGLIFSIRLIKSKILDKCFCKFGSLFLIITMISLILLGIFPKSTGLIHYYLSMQFFFFLALFLLFIGIRLIKIEEKKLGYSAFVLGCITLFTFPIFPIPPPYGSNAIIEMIGILSLCLFIFIFALRLLKNKIL